MPGRHEILAKYNFQVPRYTSYPPATQFKEDLNGELHIKWLKNVSGAVSLYVHIPFCARLCHYCGCNMRVANNYDPVSEYLSLLRKEVILIRDRLQTGIKITHLHFGGGSPTILKPGDFAKLVLFLNETFPFDPAIEISIEADPRHLSEAKIAAYAQSGVNRISLGVQDFNENVLTLINRPQPFHLTYRAIHLCRFYGIDNINFDLMYGLPAQTAESIERTIDLAVSLKPSRIAYFGYAHVPWMKRHMNLMPHDRMPGPEDRYLLQETGARFLENRGYCPIGIDHFALPDDSMTRALEQKTLHRNFQGYTTDTAQTLIGLGSSSISAFKEGYTQNHADLRSYINMTRQDTLASHKTLPFKNGDDPIARVIEELMCYLEVDLSVIRKKFGLPMQYFNVAEGRLQDLERDGIIVRLGDLIEIVPEFRVLARVVCDAFDAYSIRGSVLKKHAQAV